MSFSRFIITLAVIIILVLAVFASSRIIDALKKKTGTTTSSEKVSDAQIILTPTPSMKFTGNEIPSTGPVELTYLILSGGFISGVILRRKH